MPVSPTMLVSEATVRLIMEHPGLNNKQVLGELQKTHRGSGSDKTVAWYRSHLKTRTKLAKYLLAIADEYGTSVPSAASLTYRPKQQAPAERPRMTDADPNLQALGF